MSDLRRILLVEDDPLVRAYAAEHLRKLGYDVVEAENASQALEALDRPPQFDLLFTDVMMAGGASGPELAAQARSLRPGLRVLFTSGYSDDALQDRGRIGSTVPLLLRASVTVQAPQPPWPHAFLVPLSPTSSERR